MNVENKNYLFYELLQNTTKTSDDTKTEAKKSGTVVLPLSAHWQQFLAGRAIAFTTRLVWLLALF